jgi:Fur family ferric uptake transcriptional regulator
VTDATVRLGERSTRQKRALAAILDGATSHGERVGLTTVYNQLRTLADAGEMDVLCADEGEVLYRQCATLTHHHHLLCRRCGRTVEIAAEEVERWAAAIANEHGFGEVDHTLEIVGTCPACSSVA